MGSGYVATRPAVTGLPGAGYWRAVEAGAPIGMEPANMFWRDRTASIVDPFGYGWTFATHVKDLTEEEMRWAGEEFARKMASGSVGVGI